jgi:hypothetical protein
VKRYTDDEERRLLAERASPGHARAAVLLRLLELAMEQADALTDEHPPRCRCDLCRGNPHKGTIVRAAVGASWSCEQAAAQLDGVICAPASAGGTLAEQLRELAERAGALDAG